MNVEVLHSVVVRIENEAFVTGIQNQLAQLRAAIQRTMTQPSESNYASISAIKAQIKTGLGYSEWANFSEV